jgi:hypothetical protein
MRVKKALKVGRRGGTCMYKSNGKEEKRVPILKLKRRKYN